MKTVQEMAGFLVALVTPFDENNQVDHGALASLIRRTMAQGARGMLVGGSSAECFLLSPQERLAAMETAAQFKGQTGLMASCAAIGLDEALVYARAAKAMGYDALISTVPFYYKFGMAAIADYFRAIRQEVDLPLVLYNFPINTGVELDLNHPALRQILQDGTIAGVKQTSLNVQQIERFKNINSDLVVWGGFDETYLGARIMGADGAIGSSFNFTLPLFTKIEAAYAAGDLQAAQQLQSKANTVMETLNACGLFPSIKYALGLTGLPVGQCRRPFPSLTEESKEKIKALVAFLEEAAS